MNKLDETLEMFNKDKSPKVKFEKRDYGGVLIVQNTPITRCIYFKTNIAIEIESQYFDADDEKWITSDSNSMYISMEHMKRIKELESKLLIKGGK